MLIFILLISILSFGFLFNSSLNAEVVNKVIAVANDEVITQKDVKKFFLPLKLQLEAEYEGEELVAKLEVARKDLLRRLIQDKLLLQEAEKNNLEVAPEMVMNKLEKVKTSFPSEKEFQEAIMASGMNIDDLKKHYEEQLLIDKLIAKEIKSKVKVSPGEIKQYYNRHKLDFKRPEQVKLRQIFIPEEDEEALRKINMIKGLLNERVKFEDLALKYSKGPNSEEGGLLGIHQKGDLIPEIDQAVFKLNPGDISDIIKTRFGYHIFKIEEKFPPEAKSLQEVVSKIRKILFRQKVQLEFQHYLDNLYEKSYVSILNQK